MIIFDNIVYSLQKSGGISRFWSKITEPHLSSAMFIERSDAPVNNLYRSKQELLNIEVEHKLPKFIGRYVNFHYSICRGKYVFHSSYYRANPVANAINVVTVHDLIYEKFSSGILSKIHIAQKQKALELADCIVCVSEHTRKDMLNYYPFVRDKYVRVIPNGVEPYASKVEMPGGELFSQKFAGQQPYFLYVGHRGSCKGFNRVYQALKLCQLDMRCLVVGASFSRKEREEIENIGLSDRIINIGRVSDAELAILYSKANFFFFPSLYEGFGIPPLEAMLLGCPVLASNTSSIPEVVGDAGVLFDPMCLQSLKNGLSSIQTKDVRDRLVINGRLRAAEFSWDRASTQYNSLYLELLNSV